MGRDRPLAGRGKHAEGDGAGAGAAQQLADRDRPLGLRSRSLRPPRDERTEPPPSLQPAEEEASVAKKWEEDSEQYIRGEIWRDIVARYAGFAGAKA
jgi:hypothetical protein